MSANISPIYSRVGDIQWATISAANTAKDGTGTVQTIFTADATNGGRVDRIKIQALGTNVATNMRFFINNGSSNTVAANNSQVGEVALVASTTSETALIGSADSFWLGQTSSTDICLPIVLPPGYKINITIGTAVAAGYQVTAFGGKY